MRRVIAFLDEHFEEGVIFIALLFMGAIMAAQALTRAARKVGIMKLFG